MTCFSGAVPVTHVGLRNHGNGRADDRAAEMKARRRKTPRRKTSLSAVVPH